MTLNLRSEKGVAIFKEMVKKADEVLSKINPRLGYGEADGPPLNLGPTIW